MIRNFRNAMTVGSLACLATALASCGPDDGQVGTVDHYSLGPTAPWVDSGFSDAALAEPPLPEAVPMQVSAQGSLPAYRAGPVDRYPDSGGYAPDYGSDYAPDYGDAPSDSYESDPGIDGYGLLALASTIGGVLGNAPPDYGFDYGGVEPWAWQTGDRWVRYAEPIDDGYRYYYYQPDSVRPFLVRDPYFSYGYRGDRLVAIYDRSGRVIDPRRAELQRRVATRYAERGYDLYRTGRYASRIGVDAREWQRRRAPIWQAQQRWDQARAERREWRDWDRRHQEALAARWTQEKLVRERAAGRFAQWQRADYRGTAPRFYKEAAADRKLRQQVRAAQMQALASRQEAQQTRALARREVVERRARAERLAAARDDRRAVQVRQAAQRQQALRQHTLDQREARLAQVQDQREAVRRQQVRQSRAAEQQARHDRVVQARVNQRQPHREQVIKARAAQQQAVRERAVQARTAQQQARREQAVKARAAQQQAVRERAVQARAAQQQVRRERTLHARAAQQQARRAQVAQVRGAQQQVHREQAARARAARQQSVSHAREAGRGAAMKRLARDD